MRVQSSHTRFSIEKSFHVKFKILTNKSWIVCIGNKRILTRYNIIVLLNKIAQNKTQSSNAIKSIERYNKIVYLNTYFFQSSMKTRGTRQQPWGQWISLRWTFAIIQNYHIVKTNGRRNHTEISIRVIQLFTETHTCNGVRKNNFPAYFTISR